jgi:hypothetical protein
LLLLLLRMVKNVTQQNTNLVEPKCGITADVLAIAMTTNSSFTAFVLHPSASPL